MSQPEVDASSSTSGSRTYISPDVLAEAVERRTRALPAQISAAQLAAEHERRQRFRRMVDPGILRPNNKEQAYASMKTLLTISENLIREPDNDKFRQFKPTNNVIKRNLVDRKGALEYALEMGFHAEVDNFQPYYRFNPRRTEDLKIGAAILKEFLDLEAEKQARIDAGRKAEKAVAQAAAERVKLAFMDDRRTKIEADEREKQYREGRLAALAAAKEKAAASTPPQQGHVHADADADDDESPANNMPGSGHILGASATATEGSDDEDPQ